MASLTCKLIFEPIRPRVQAALLIAGMALATTAQPVCAADAVQSAIETIAARLNRVEGYAASIRIIPAPTDTFLAQFAADTRQTPARVRARFTQVRTFDIKTRSGGKFLLDERIESAEGTLASRRQHAFDGQESFAIVFALDKEVPFMDVQIGSDVSSVVGPAIDYFITAWGIDGSHVLRVRLDRLLKASKDRIDVISLPSASLDRLVLRLPLDGTGIPSRVEITLDAWRDYALRQLDVSYLIQNSWQMSRRLRVTSLIDVDDGVNPGVRHVVPNEIVVDVINGRGEVTTVETAKIERIEVNPPFSSSSFTPEIEVGSSVRHAVTKESWVHGGRPTAAMEQAIAKRAAQAKKDLAALNPAVDFSHASPPPRGWQDLLPWLGAVVGLAALICAGIVRVRQSP